MTISCFHTSKIATVLVTFFVESFLLLFHFFFGQIVVCSFHIIVKKCVCGRQSLFPHDIIIFPLGNFFSHNLHVFTA